MRTSFRRSGALVMAIAIGLSVSACGDTNNYDAGGYAVDGGSVESLASADFAGGDFDAAPGGSASEVTSQMIVSGNVSIQTNDPRGQAAAFVEFVKGEGGLIDFSSQSEYDSNPYASVTARIPADKFDGVVDELSRFGKITNSSIYSEEVGQQVADLQARIDVLEDSIARLTELMEQATTVEDLLSAESSLTERQSELDSMNAQLSWLSDQVSMSRLDVSFSTPATATSGFTLAKAWQFLLESVELVLYSVIVLLPWAVLAGAIAWAAVAISRKRRTKQAAKGVRPDPNQGHPAPGTGAQGVGIQGLGVEGVAVEGAEEVVVEANVEESGPK